MATDDAPAPAYTADYTQDDLWAWIDSAAARAKELGLPLTHAAQSQYASLNYKPLQRLPDADEATPVDHISPRAAKTNARRALQQQIVDGFFTAVRSGQTAVVARYVARGLVSPDVYEGATTAMMLGEAVHADDDDDDDPFDFMLGTTPLLAAVESGRIAMVRQLLALGADVDRLGVPPGFVASPGLVAAGELWQTTALSARLGFPPPWMPTWDKEHMRSRETKLEIARTRKLRRTPLMVAAATGRLAVVELLLLRRRVADEDVGEGAPANDAIVAPDGQTALRLAAAADHRDVVAVLPVRRGGAGQRFRMRHAAAMVRAQQAGHSLGKVARGVCWQLPKLVVWDAPWLAAELVQRHGGLCVRRIARVVARGLVRLAKGLAQLLRALPGLLRDAGRWLVADLPRALARALRAVGWALLRFGAWAAHAVAGLGRVLGRAAMGAAAAVHTAVVAAATWFRAATLADVARGLRAAGAALLVGLPLWLVHVLRQLGATAADALVGVFGCLGRAVVVLAELLASVLWFVPKQLGRLAAAAGSSVGAAAHEAAVFVNPKL